MRIETSLRTWIVIAWMMCSGGMTDRCAAVEFGAAQRYPVGTAPLGVIVGDFNDDGKPDIAVANSGSGNVSILLGNGDGTFGTAVNFDVGITTPSSISTGDFNGDGKLDLVVFQPGDTRAGIAGAVSILLGNGDGTFQAPKTLALTTLSSQLAVADFNADKKSDLAVSEFDSNAKTLMVDIFLAKGDGSFQAAPPTTVTNLENGSFASADFNHDLKPDLVVNTLTGVLILIGKGDGTFQQGATVPTKSGYIPFSVSIGDVDNDGNQDLLVFSIKIVCLSELPGGCIYERFRDAGLFLGDGDGTFQEEKTISGGRGYLSASWGDFNGDGKLDLYSGYDTVLLGRGDGTFSPAIPSNLTAAPTAIADLNGDKLSDLIVLDRTNASVNVILNTSQTTGADLDISSSKASPEPVGVGTNLAYSAVVLNEGPQGTTGVTFTDTLPNGVSFVSASTSQGSCIQSNGIVTCNIGAIASAFDVSVTIVVIPSTKGTLTNTMNVKGTESDLAMANNTAAQNSTVVPVYTLTVTKSGNGSGTIVSDPGPNGAINCGTTCSATYLSGTTVGIGDNIDTGSILQSWGGACLGVPTNTGCSVTMDSDKTVTAAIALGVTLNVTFSGTGTGTVTSSDGSINCNSTSGGCSSLNLPGTSISLTAAPSGGSTFAGWSGACTGTDPNTCRVTLNTNQSVTATFNPPPDFALQPASTSLTLNRGAQVNDALMFPTQGGFSGTIALTCAVSGPAPMPSCGVSPNSVTPGNSATLTVNATGLSVAMTPQGGTPGLYAAWLPVGLMGCVLAIGPNKKRRRIWALGLLVMVAPTLPAACGGGNSTPTHVPQTYMVRVTATSGAIQHSTNITVTVP